MTESAVSNGPTDSPAPVKLTRLPSKRLWVNRITRGIVALGGAGVIAAIGLIFFYLLWVVAPVFSGASVDFEKTHPVADGDHPLLVDINESGEIGIVMLASGTARFFDMGSSVLRGELTLPTALVTAKPVYQNEQTYALLDTHGDLRFLSATYPVEFDGDRRSITPVAAFPFEAEPVVLGDVVDFDVTWSGTDLVIANLSGDQTLTIHHYRDTEVGFPLEFPRTKTIDLDRAYDRVYFGPRGRWLFLTDAKGVLEAFELRRPTAPNSVLVDRLAAEQTTVTAMGPLLGRYSMLVADDTGTLTQWFLVRDEFGYGFQAARAFETDAPIRHIVPEQRRKGFAAVDADNRLHLFYTTSHRELSDQTLAQPAGAPLVIGPRADRLLSHDGNGGFAAYRVHNEHPEISWSSLWAQVWYEGYQEPVFSWQSSSADNDFEPKFSLVPLAFGTLKAALYAMIFAVPIAIMGALYTAYFMTPSMRRLVKPGIEIMAALPTVILGFLAGLWLAPLVEANLHSVLALFVVVPAGMLVFSRGWALLPENITQRFDGWYGAIAIPVLVLLSIGAFEVGPIIESTLLGGDTRTWFRETLGLDYDQRNALIVGIAMGLAVIPAIFSIAEDAIYGVPQHLINGSLALGATPWQTLIRVVILTASPGIFSAIMIGLGRAVGETMIVLMATGNTPVMDLNIFQGMRTFAANIAVELPESEVSSTHYRILFLAALVLFLITFAFNTVAEVVRQRLRSRYGDL